MEVCEIYNVVHKRSFRWKWRHQGADGCVRECVEEYALYFECVAAARAGGYEPRPAWTGPVTLLLPAPA